MLQVRRIAATQRAAAAASKPARTLSVVHASSSFSGAVRCGKRQGGGGARGCVLLLACCQSLRSQAHAQACGSQTGRCPATKATAGRTLDGRLRLIQLRQRRLKRGEAAGMWVVCRPAGGLQAAQAALRQGSDCCSCCNLFPAPSAARACLVEAPREGREAVHEGGLHAKAAAGRAWSQRAHFLVCHVIKAKG